MKQFLETHYNHKRDPEEPAFLERSVPTPKRNGTTANGRT